MNQCEQYRSQILAAINGELEDKYLAIKHPGYIVWTEEDERYLELMRDERDRIIPFDQHERMQPTS